LFLTQYKTLECKYFLFINLKLNLSMLTFVLKVLVCVPNRFWKLGTCDGGGDSTPYHKKEGNLKVDQLFSPLSIFYA